MPLVNISLGLNDAYITRNILKSHVDKLKKELPEMDEYSTDCATIDIDILEHIIQKFQQEIDIYEKKEYT